MPRDEFFYGFEMFIANRFSPALRRKPAHGAEYCSGSRGQEFPEFAKTSELNPDEREQFLFEGLGRVAPPFDFFLRQGKSIRYQLGDDCFLRFEIVEKRSGRNT